METFLVFLLSI